MKEKQDLVPVPVRLTPTLYEALRKLSFETRIPMAEHVRRAVDDYLKKQK